ncbi:conserved unknown protein [Ectocarpus siliculosus]|uniref:inositol-phosphate phosphatase n=1 Tax=Ectocarpus siliculosus TaxID=2880 RepID=D8LQJ2_ECTSI|nr:conserved unknown protein [Ectocarpus siliculosus]|eukprot:CBN78756.1 conserved unknown protein [Ectocarpus siliculosus]
MRASSAYPQVSNRQYVKFVAIVVCVCFLFAFFADRPTLNNEGEPALPGTDINLRGGQDGALPAAASGGSAKLSDLIAVGLGLTELASQEIKDVKAAGAEELRVKGLTKEGVEEPVTVADTNSNSVFVNGYRHFFPGVQMLSEETEPEKADTKLYNPALPAGLRLESNPSLDLSEVLVIVDPLDATKEFGEDLLEYVTTMVCVVYQGEPIAGIINQVFEEDKPPVVGVIPLQPGDQGVLFNRAKQDPVGDAAHTVTISRSHTGEGGNVVEKYLEGHQTLLAGGAGYKSLLVLDGKAEAYVHVTAIKSWDVCAAEAVMKASGGGFSDIEGKQLAYPMEYDSTHSQALFKNGIIATASKEQQDFFVTKLDGNLS